MPIEEDISGFGFYKLFRMRFTPVASFANNTALGGRELQQQLRR